jgi:hypothetical protein
MPDLRSLPRTRYGGIQNLLKRLDSGFRRNDILFGNCQFVDRLYIDTESKTKQQLLFEMEALRTRLDATAS